MTRPLIVLKAWRPDMQPGDVIDATALGLTDSDLHFLLGSGFVALDTISTAEGARTKPKKRKD